MKLRSVLSSLLLTSTLFAADLHLRIVDPQQAAVPQAQVIVFSSGIVQASSRSSATGEVSFSGLPSANLTVRVLVPGFAGEEQHLVPSGSLQTIALRVAPAQETVNVTTAGVAAAPEDASGRADILTANQLEGLDALAASDALRFLPGAIVNTVGRRGGQASLFVRGGESRYNKVMIDGVPVNDPGGTFDFGVAPIPGTERIEFARGAQSTLYGSDAMTSVVQIFTAPGRTRVPEVRLASEGGTFGTARGDASIAGANGRFDYRLFADQAFTNGQGVNDVYSNGAQGASFGLRLREGIFLRLSARHSHSFTGVPGEWNFNGNFTIPPDHDGFSRFNSALGSAELDIAKSPHWRHTLRGFDYHFRRINKDPGGEPGRLDNFGFNIDFPTDNITDANRAGFSYQGEYWSRSWTRSTFGYEFEKETAMTGDFQFGITHGSRLNHAVYGQEFLTLGRLSATVGLRFVHNEFFGNKVVPRVGLSVVARQGNERIGSTRLGLAFAEGIKAPRFEEVFANGSGIVPNPNLRAEENRSFEAGIEQSLGAGRSALTLNYFRNQFRDRIDFQIIDFTTFTGQYVNVNRAYAQGAELDWHTRLTQRFSFDTGYTYLATRIVEAPFAFDPLLGEGRPLLRRPKHSASFLLSYAGRRWGGTLGTSYVGRRADSDFFGYGYDHAAGYARLDFGGWLRLNRWVSAYANVGNALNKHYEEVSGYPALRANFRAGLRFRFGGD